MTKQALLEDANRWLEKAIKFEADGKPSKFVDMALEKAVKLEADAFSS